MRKRRVITGMLLLIAGYAAAGQQIVESIAAVVGNEVVYLSEIEGQVVQLKAERDPTPVNELRCRVFEDQLIQKLFLDQARIDSIEVSPENVESDLNSRLTDYIRRAGSEQALETYFNKSMAEIRKDLREMLTNQYIVQETQVTIAQDITVTPEEIRKYYNTIPKDSLPLVPRKVQMSIITVEPPDMESSKAEVRQRLLELRSRIIKGESFSTLAVLYSEDPGTAPKGGELGFMMRGELAKPYAEAAWSLKQDVVSKIVETEFGFHIIQLIERKGDMVNSRHILMKPKLSVEQTEWAILKLDTIAGIIRSDSVTFERAAMRYSADKATRANGGKMVSENPSERVNWLTLDELPREINLVVRDMKLGEISEPFRTTDPRGNYIYCIVKLDDEIAPHRVNMKDDYNSLSDAALNDKQGKIYNEWIAEKIRRTYIRISDEFRDCRFHYSGWFE
ncbi:MAG: peptidylprolyl isomerase [Bacteroidales bacterium]|nr:peptidylprolyl isomerase [Bacteroidales bacterium]MDT8374752.1 peptidylprolyl isomerase [Bacteroidales bacterium]